MKVIKLSTKTVRKLSEDEMILEFLKGEINSKRFNEDLMNVLISMNLKKNIIINGNIRNSDENNIRKEIMNKFRGYPDKELFNNFPKNINWKYVTFDKDDINHIYYINYDYWNELSNSTSLPIEAAKNINKGKEIYDVSNKPYLDGLLYLKNNNFPPVILLTCNYKKYVILEGHSRMTVYGLNPNNFDKTYGYVGYISENEMSYYDERMI